MAATIRVEVLRAWPRRHQSVWVELPENATLADALAASGMALEGVAGYAVHGERAQLAQSLRDGDRVELLGALLADPKDARRLRAQRKVR